MNQAQKLKMLGLLPGVTLSKLSDVSLSYAMLAQLQNRLCDHPDQPDVEIADSSPSTLAAFLEMDSDHANRLIGMHLRMFQATGRGSWPAACPATREQYPDNHAVIYYVDEDSIPNHYARPVTTQELEGLVTIGVWGTREYIFDTWSGKRMCDVGFDLMEESNRRAGCAHIRSSDHSEKHHIHIKFEIIGGSVIGYAYFNDGSCGDHVDQRLDSSWRPDLHSFAYLVTHETGHNNNLPHTFSGQGTHHGIMSYDRGPLFQGFGTGEQPYRYTRDPSWPQLIRQYGGEPVPQDDEPDDPTDPPGENDWTDTPTEGGLIIQSHRVGAQRKLVIRDGI
jgi:hypothetical protein